MKKILVAIDGSDSCVKATNQAKNLALMCKSNITFITIVSTTSVMGFNKKAIENKAKEREGEIVSAKDMLDKCDSIYYNCKTELEENNLSVKKEVIEGDNPAEEICEYAKRHNFDLIILADKGRSNIGKFLLGSTSEKVVRYSSISVLIAK